MRKSPQVRAIVFDWDLTLWNSWDIHLAAVAHVAERLDLPLPPKEEIAATYSSPFERYLEGLFRQRTEAAIRCYLDFYNSNTHKLGHLYEGIKGMLNILKERGYRLALLSDKRLLFGQPELEQSGVGDLFDLTLFHTDNLAFKPNPQGLGQVTKTLAIGKGDVLYMGDSATDIQCAQQAGVKSAAALWASLDKEAVLRERPDYVWHKIEEAQAALISDVA